MSVETYEYTISGTLAGQFVQTVMHFNLDNTAATAPFPMALAIIAKSNASAGFLAKWCDSLPNDYSITTVRCRQLLPAGGPTALYLASQLLYNNGTRGAASATSSIAPLIIWITNLRPSKTGRTFLPGVASIDISENQLSGGIVTAMEAFAAMFRDGFTTTTPAYLTQGSILRRSLHTADDISQFRVSPVIGNQRRRQKPI